MVVQRVEAILTSTRDKIASEKPVQQHPALQHQDRHRDADEFDQRHTGNESSDARSREHDARSREQESKDRMRGKDASNHVLAARGGGNEGTSPRSDRAVAALGAAIKAIREELRRPPAMVALVDDKVCMSLCTGIPF